MCAPTCAFASRKSTFAANTYRSPFHRGWRLFHAYALSFDSKISRAKQNARAALYAQKHLIAPTEQSAITFDKNLGAKQQFWAFFASGAEKNAKFHPTQNRNRASGNLNGQTSFKLEQFVGRIDKCDRVARHGEDEIAFVVTRHAGEARGDALSQSVGLRESRLAVTRRNAELAKSARARAHGINDSL